MIRQLKVAVAFLLLAVAAPAFGQAATGFTLITASHVYGNLLGQYLTTGQIQFTAVSWPSMTPISFRVGGTNGQMVRQPFSWPIVNGVLTADSSAIAPQLPDTSLTFPVNVAYCAQILDPNTGLNILGPGYCIQPTGSSFNLDNFNPGVSSMLATTLSPAMIQAALETLSGCTTLGNPYVPASNTCPVPGSGGGGGGITWLGAWSSLSTYTALQAVSYAGSSYVAIATSTNQNPSSTTGYWNLMAQQGSAGSTGATGATGGAGSAGSAGAAATIAAGTATALSAGASPTVSNSGSSSAAVFNFGIPAGATGATGPTGATGINGAPIIIADDDCTYDWDCAYTQTALMHWSDLGLVNILAEIASSANVQSAPVLKIFRDYSSKTFPIGAFQGTGVPSSSYSGWTNVLVTNFAPGDTRSNYPDCLTTYRTALATAASNSVTLVVTGVATCIYSLLQSPADSISPLTGAQLAKTKVNSLVVMAGMYPSGTEYNMADDPARWSSVFATWTTQNGYSPVYALGLQYPYISIETPTSWPNSNPARYMQVNTPVGVTSDLDVSALYYAIFRQINSDWVLSANGTNTVDASTGANTWSSSTASGHYYLSASGSSTVDTAVQSSMNHLPSAQVALNGVVYPVIYPQYSLLTALTATSVGGLLPSTWTSGHTFVHVYQPSGSPLAPTIVDANTLNVNSALTVQCTLQDACATDSVWQSPWTTTVEPQLATGYPLGATDTTMHVISTTGWPAAGTGHITTTAEEEIGFSGCTGTAPNITCNISRGKHGTTPTAVPVAQGNMAGVVSETAACSSCPVIQQMANYGGSSFNQQLNPGLGPDIQAGYGYFNTNLIAEYLFQLPYLAGSAGLAVGNTPGTTLGHVIAQPAATTSVDGYLAHADWNTFNGKQASSSHGTCTIDWGGTLVIVAGTGGVTTSCAWNRTDRTVSFNIAITATGTATSAATFGTTLGQTTGLPYLPSLSDNIIQANSATGTSYQTGNISQAGGSITFLYVGTWPATSGPVILSGKYQY